jgi:hypothetical protein
VDTKLPNAQKAVYMYGGKKPCDEKAMKSGGHELKGKSLVIITITLVVTRHN